MRDIYIYTYIYMYRHIYPRVWGMSPGFHRWPHPHPQPYQHYQKISINFFLFFQYGTKQHVMSLVNRFIISTTLIMCHLGKNNMSYWSFLVMLNLDYHENQLKRMNNNNNNNCWPKSILGIGAKAVSYFPSISDWHMGNELVGDTFYLWITYLFGKY